MNARYQSKNIVGADAHIRPVYRRFSFGSMRASTPTFHKVNSYLFSFLGAVEVGVNAAFFQKIIVAAAFGDDTIGNGDDPPGRTDRG